MQSETSKNRFSHAKQLLKLKFGVQIGLPSMYTFPFGPGRKSKKKGSKSKKCHYFGLTPIAGNNHGDLNKVKKTTGNKQLTDNWIK